MHKKMTWGNPSSLTMPLDESRIISGYIKPKTIFVGAVSLDEYIEKSLKPFCCKHCGGTSYSMKDGRNVCDYCGSTLILSKD